MPMFPPATDWATISSLATAGGTLVLAVATFASVRSANRSARVAEQALVEQRQPMFAQSRLEDPVQKIMFVEHHWVQAAGGRAVAEHVGRNVYLAISLRNVGAGIGVCQAWTVTPGFQPSTRAPTHTPESSFRLQSRDLYIPAGDIGMWQGALRDPEDPAFAGVVEAIDGRGPISIELLYSDQLGRQRMITRFGLEPVGDATWLASVNRHWFLERPGPRSEQNAQAAYEAIQRRVDAAALEAERAGRADEDGARPPADVPGRIALRQPTAEP